MHLQRPLPQPRSEEYYASHNIQSTNFFFTSPSTVASLFTRSWLPTLTPKAVVFMMHGYGNDISWTFQSTPIFLAYHGYACFALDLPGHGRSQGLKAFVPDLNTVIHDCVAFFDSVIKQQCYLNLNLKCFLYGESMGGAICLLIHLLRHCSPVASQFHGAVMAALMCKIFDRIRPRWPIPSILTFAARLLPTLPVVPAADLVEKFVKVQGKRIVAISNPIRYVGRPRLRTVLELLRATDDLSARLSDVTIPFIVLH